jgi:uncharacterized damage-inducible protein DinB
MSSEREKLAQVFDDLEEDRRALLAELGALSDEQLAFSPHPGVWTIHQIVCHMALAEQLLLYHRAQKETEAKDGAAQDAGRPEPKRGLRDRVMFHFLRVFFALGIPVKAPIDAVIPPEEPPPVEHLADRWTEMRRVIREWVEGMDDERLRRPIIRHTFAQMDVFQALAFTRWHFDRHRKQIAERRRTPGFPA